MHYFGKNSIFPTFLFERTVSQTHKKGQGKLACPFYLRDKR